MLVKIDTDKVCRFYGGFLLAATTGNLLAEFLDMWQKAVPVDITTDLAQVADLVRFTKASLPLTNTNRLTVLFSARKRWMVEEISLL